MLLFSRNAVIDSMGQSMFWVHWNVPCLTAALFWNIIHFLNDESISWKTSDQKKHVVWNQNTVNGTMRFVLFPGFIWDLLSTQVCMMFTIDLILTILKYCWIIIVRGNQCSWISWVSLSHEFTSLRTFYKVMNCLVMYCNVYTPVNHEISSLHTSKILTIPEHCPHE